MYAFDDFAEAAAKAIELAGPRSNVEDDGMAADFAGSMSPRGHSRRKGADSKIGVKGVKRYG